MYLGKFGRSVRLAMAGLAMATSFAGSAYAQSGNAVTLKWALWDWDKVAYYKPLIAAYQAKNPNVKFESVDLGSQDYQQMIATQLAGGSKDIDIVTVKDVPNYTNLVRAGSISDLSGFMTEQKIDPASFGGLVDELKIDGKIYALPFRSDFWVVYYNKDIFDKAGVTYPTNDMTWAQFDQIATKLAGGMGANKTYGALFHTWRSTVQLPGILDGKKTLAGPDYAFLKPWYERALALQKAGVVPSYGSLKTSNTHYSALFFNGTIGMLPMGTWFVGTQIAKVASGESKSKNWGIVKFPHPDGVAAGTTAAQISGLAVNTNSAHKAEVLDFIKFVTGPEGAAIIAGTGTIPTVRTPEVTAKIASLPGFPQDQASKDALQSGKSFLEMAVNPNAAKIEVVLNRAHDSIMTDNISIDDGLKEMTDGVKAIK
ncbi:sugar ABC transporter substrate-binding protein [Neorhizobium galegae]|uniref:ABC transporter substrate-binding protein n=1 Tax=Neorhizobium galegae TaxID=399 RepID=UPI0006213A9F|nr:sugar ABC transporter substrate-binding protein [Neorhizobium galegae]KAA9383138.1 sugar ABC transporter substrate-binding protein [Neorhizobium galegae]MCM2497597.1 sugar ABC transporter substrate-binding protein [Neorhizobium galegae]CDZ26779.1 Extracellular solute-binding protein family 1 [Neorhizobium galegae bv. officinalis]CDZ37194.1 Extracellular solute-binding protein family 1 [Neorhizobium galegae bv. officinalis]